MPEHQIETKSKLNNYRKDGVNKQEETLYKKEQNNSSAKSFPQPDTPTNLILSLQKNLGNRYVQRLVDLSRSSEDDSEVTPEIESSIQSSRGGGQSLGSSVRSNMESSFGVDFSGVKVHTDSRADSLNRSLNARAFTTGKDIFFRGGEYNPGSAGGKHLLAHELTHVVQQNGDELQTKREENQTHIGCSCGNKVQTKLTVGSPGDIYEQEADEVADSVMRMSSSSGPVQRMCTECEDELHKKTTGTIQRAFDDSVVKSGHKHEILNRSLNLVSFTRGKKSIFRKKNDDFKNIRAKKLPDQKPAHLPYHNITISTPSKISPHDVLQKQDDEEDNNIIGEAIEEASVELLNTVLPVGNGFYFEINGGITWGYPIYTGGSAIVYVDRVSEASVRLLVRKQGRLAFDTGVGGSFMFGRQRSPGSSRNNGIGVGAEAGANFMAGVLGTVIEEYTIPTEVFLGAATAHALNSAWSSSPASTLSIPVQAILDAHAYQYMVHQRVEAGVFAQGDAEIGAGIRRPSDSFNESQSNREIGRGVQGGGRTWGPNSSERDFQGSRPDLTRGDPIALLNFLSLFLSANVNAQAIGGLDQRRNGNTTVTSLFIEGQVGVVLGIPIPVVGAFLSTLPPDAGAGVELQFEQTPGVEHKVRVIIYTKQGEDQYYAGTAGQQNMVFDLTSILTPDEILRALQTGRIPNISLSSVTQAFEKVSFFNRLVLGGQIFRGFGALVRRQRGARSLLSDTTLSRARRVYGVNLEAYVDFAAEMNGPDFASIASRLMNTAEGAASSAAGAEDISSAYQRVSAFLSGYIESEEFDELLDNILDDTAVTMAKLRIQVGGGIGLSARLAEGAKIRGDISAEVGLSCELDLTSFAKGRITLRSLIDLIQQAIDNPVQYLPNCPIIRELYSAGGDGNGLGSSTGNSRTGSLESQNSRDSDRGTGTSRRPRRGNNTQERENTSRTGTDITQNYPDNIPEITFPILDVYGPISLDTTVGSTMQLRIEIQVPHRDNTIIRVPVNLRTVENTDTQLVLEVTQTWWAERYRIGSRSGERYTLEKPN